jgi:nitrous oxidase accessory protein
MIRIFVFVALLLALSPFQSVQADVPFDLQAAIDAASEGSTLTMPPGTYVGPVVVSKEVHLIGETGPNGERAIIDGNAQGSVLTILASGTTVENVVIRNGGHLIEHEDAGIVIENAEDVQLVGNRVEDVLYGIKGVQANRILLRNNYIEGRNIDVARRGDGIRLWQSVDCLVEGNTVERTRDVLFWFSDNTVVRNNHFHGNRYGIHMMYTDGMQILNNALEHNSVGVYLMYSIDVLIEGNTLHANRGPSGYGIALKDMDAVTIHNNYMVDNRVGLFFDNSPARIEIEQSIARNVMAYNDIGVLMMPAVQRNVLVENTFLDNLEQVGVKGGGSQSGDQLGGNRWDGNFWSDYVGYDKDEAGIEDGVGDISYRSESLFENLADRHPNLQLFHFSPVEAAIDMAAQAFPVIKPKPKLTDAIPLMSPVLPNATLQMNPVNSPMGWLALGMLVAAAGLFGGELRRGFQVVTGYNGNLAAAINKIEFPAAGTAFAPAPAKRQVAASLSTRAPDFALQPALQAALYEDKTMISVENLSKHYPQPGRPWWSDATVTAVDNLSFELQRGQALALWGSNGAGKTTVLKCLLGLLDCRGELRIDGLDLRRDGRRARALLGYVPQELAFHAAMSVEESCRFYANLKHVTFDRIPVVLEQVGLAGQMQKRVGALSGGMKQRLALALALLADPPVLLLDEPTSNLDAAARAEFLAMLVALRKNGKSLLFTSHHVTEVDQLADQVLLLRDGQRVAQGSPLELMGHLLPERAHPVRHIKVIVAAEHQPLAQQLLSEAGYATSPNGRGIWVTVRPEQKAEPLAVLHSAAVKVIDVEM